VRICIFAQLANSNVLGKLPQSVTRTIRSKMKIAMGAEFDKNVHVTVNPEGHIYE
jgi:hypothetical protein